MTIWKFPIEIAGANTVSMPIGAVILCVQMQRDYPCLWALVDPTAATEPRRFVWVGTGQVLSDPLLSRYIGTVQIMNGRLVFHLFEER
jgi:hypothetical protein